MSMIFNPCLICAMKPYEVIGHVKIDNIEAEIHSCPICGKYTANPLTGEIIKKLDDED